MLTTERVLLRHASFNGKGSFLLDTQKAIEILRNQIDSHNNFKDLNSMTMSHEERKEVMDEIETLEEDLKEHEATFKALIEKIVSRKRP